MTADTTTTISHMIDAIVNGTTRLGRLQGHVILRATHADGTNHIIEFSNRTIGAACLRDTGGDIDLHGLPLLIARDARNTLR